MKSLNRIERNFIFETFMKDLPTLRIMEISGGVKRFNHNSYRIENNIVELPQGLPPADYTMMFEHKQRLIVADISIQVSGEKSFFVFPDILSLYDDTKAQSTNGTLTLFYDSDQANKVKPTVLTVTILPEFPLFDYADDFLFPQTNEQLLTNIRVMLQYQGKKYGNDFCISRLYRFLMSVSELNPAYNPAKKITLVFCSEQTAVFFLPQRLEKLISNSTKKQLELKVGRRFITMPLENTVGLMHINPSVPDEPPLSLIALSVKNLQIEDKRFLSEMMYRRHKTLAETENSVI